MLAIEPSTGRILAMVQSPSFDPNELSSPQLQGGQRLLPGRSRTTRTSRCSTGRSPRRNPPGSTFKLVTAAAALESGRFSRTPSCPGRPPTPRPAPAWRSPTTSTGRAAPTADHPGRGHGHLLQHRLRVAGQRARRRRAARPGREVRLQRLLRDPAEGGHLALPRGPGRAADRACRRSASSTCAPPRCRWPWSPPRSPTGVDDAPLPGRPDRARPTSPCSETSTRPSSPRR